jgi:AcrR family transcriptional regulator
MARQTTRRHAQGEASRRTILEATLRIAGERGYVGTTLAQVTKASGLPASSVYWHFHNKDELLADALEHGFRLAAPRRGTGRRAGQPLPSARRGARVLADGPDDRAGDRTGGR